MFIAVLMVPKLVRLKTKKSFAPPTSVTCGLDHAPMLITFVSPLPMKVRAPLILPNGGTVGVSADAPADNAAASLNACVPVEAGTAVTTGGVLRLWNRLPLANGGPLLLTPPVIAPPPPPDELVAEPMPTRTVPLMGPLFWFIEAFDPTETTA